MAQTSFLPYQCPCPLARRIRVNVERSYLLSMLAQPTAGFPIGKHTSHQSNVEGSDLMLFDSILDPGQISGINAVTRYSYCFRAFKVDQVGQVCDCLVYEGDPAGLYKCDTAGLYTCGAASCTNWCSRLSSHM